MCLGRGVHMVITFYRTTDDYRKLDKTLGTALGTATGQLHERVSDTQLTIKLPSSVFNIVTQSNYVMIDLFQKYYFLGPYEVENNCVLITLKEDVRMSFSTQIKNVVTTVTRNAYQANGYIKDANYNALAYEGIQYKAFPKALDDTSCILTTVG